jgi:hypothetical protein
VCLASGALEPVLWRHLQTCLATGALAALGALILLLRLVPDAADPRDFPDAKVSD